MGYLQAREMREFLDNEAALRWHLQWNLYPPMPDAYNICLEALEAVREGDEDRILEDGSFVARAYKIVEVLHLDAFLEDLDEVGCDPDDDA